MGPEKTLLDRYKIAKRGGTISSPPTTLRPQAAGRGWGGDKSLSPGTGGEEGLTSKKDYSKALHALRHRGLGGFIAKFSQQFAWFFQLETKGNQEKRNIKLNKSKIKAKGKNIK